MALAGLVNFGLVVALLYYQVTGDLEKVSSPF